jgi:hypothetical protein
MYYVTPATNSAIIFTHTSIKIKYYVKVHKTANIFNVHSFNQKLAAEKCKKKINCKTVRSKLSSSLFVKKNFFCETCHENKQIRTITI